MNHPWLAMQAKDEELQLDKEALVLLRGLAVNWQYYFKI
jgi:hypothetical protein